MSRALHEPSLPLGYQSLTAEEKSDYLWDSVILPTRHADSDLPPLCTPLTAYPRKEISVVVKTDLLEKALTRTADVMEPGRPKVIHACGSVAKVSLLTSSESPFTGLLGPGPRGGAVGLIRMSLVKSPAGSKPFIPALGLKFFIDGQPSSDLLAMNHTIGQGRDHNLFSNSMTNDLTGEHSELPIGQRIMGVLFRRVSHEPRRLTSDHLAERCRDGSIVTHSVSPRRLVFRPTKAARDFFKHQAGVDFRVLLSKMDEGTTLYTVSGATDSDEFPVGELKTSSPFISSDGGDRLHFRHVQDTEDLKA